MPYKKGLEIIVGNTYGELTLLEIFKQNNKRMVRCLCSCGKEKIGKFYLLRNQKNPSCGCETTKLLQKRSRKEPGECSYVYLYNRNKNNAKNRKYEFNLTFLEFKQIVNNSCYYCGLSPQPYNYYLKKNKERVKSKTIVLPESVDLAWIAVNGIDRVDNNKGYTLENCVTCCGQCNTSKLNYSQEEFLHWIERITKYQRNV